MNKTMASNIRRALNVDRLLLLFTFAALSYGFLSLWRIKHPKPAEPQAIASAVGRTLSAVDFLDDTWAATRPVRSSSMLLYVFATTCHFCESQRDQIGSILAQLPNGTVLTGSIEPNRMTAKYWSDRRIALRQPSQLSPNTLENMGINGVPALLVISADGRVTSAYIGTALGWDRKTFERLLTAGRL